MVRPTAAGLRDGARCSSWRRRPESGVRRCSTALTAHPQVSTGVLPAARPLSHLATEVLRPGTWCSTRRPERSTARLPWAGSPRVVRWEATNRAAACIPIDAADAPEHHLDREFAL